MLRLYNTLTRKKELLRPLTEGQVGIYTCGPTLHDCAHIGLIRRLLSVDVLKRLLQADGYQVRHIVNLTDIDDKTIAESGRRGVTLAELTGQYATEFYGDVAALRMFPADHYPRATEHVEDMLAMTRRLIGAGLAYERQRSVYFDIGKHAGYGKLSRVDLSKIKAGATVELDYYEKDNPKDFTLVRRSDLKELRRRITYQTEWGNVRPGWHIECAAMAARYLGTPFDIHTSGQDLTFPHNENENAICEALSGHAMARYWMHTGLMLTGGKKMSRSAGTALTLRDLLGRGYTGSEVRYFLLLVHYRRPCDFSFAGLDAARRELARLNAVIRHLRHVRRGGGPHREVDELVEAADHAFFAALRDDLNVPKAKARLFELLRALNARLDAPTFSRCDAQLALDFLYRADRVLAVLDFGPDPLVDEHVQALLAERAAARTAGDYARADALRAELVALGVTVEDTASGARVRKP
ncbi:MAG TPA: cysteine--tRNA ligase [Polyangia bacterium]|jgi:cysteinyl-tRNA synthetase